MASSYQGQTSVTPLSVLSGCVASGREIAYLGSHDPFPTQHTALHFRQTECSSEHSETIKQK